MKKLRVIFAILIIYALTFSANAAQYLIPGGQVIGMELQDNTVTIAAIRDIAIDGDTYLYLITADEQLFKAKAADHEAMLLLKAGDRVELTCSGNTVLSCKKLPANP